MGLLMAAAEIEIDKSKGLFHNIRQMQEWRNLVTHSSPYAIEPTEICDTTRTPRKLHEKNKHRDYARMATHIKAKRFYQVALGDIGLVSDRTGQDHRTSEPSSLLGLLRHG